MAFSEDYYEFLTNYKNFVTGDRMVSKAIVSEYGDQRCTCRDYDYAGTSNVNVSQKTDTYEEQKGHNLNYPVHQGRKS